MASKATLLSRTAFPNSQMRAIMVEEVLRRLRNYDPESSWEERGKHLTMFASSMKSSGHTESFRRTVFSKAVSRFCKELDAHGTGEADIYRSREERNRQREMKGGKSTKDSWFRKGDGEDRVTSVLRVPYTPRGELKGQVTTLLKANRAPSGLKTKVQEDGGSKLRFCLMKSDPFPRDNCQRSTCPLTRGEQECREQCFQAHCNYVILCQRCDPPDQVTLSSSVPSKQAPDVAASSTTTSEETVTPQQRLPWYAYYGETARGCNRRYSQHVDKYRAKKGFMWDHVNEVHNGERGDIPANDFYMKLCNVDRDPIRRVVRESVRIKTAREREDEGGGGTRVLNDKSEWFGVKVVSADFKQE